MTSLRTIIVDDENLARRGLQLRLQDIPGIDLVEQCHNGPDALRAVAELSPDLMFLDIEMPGMNGFQVLEQLQSDNMPMIIFVTAYHEYAVEAFRVHAIDYVLKPVDEERLRDAVDRAMAQRQQQETAKTKEMLLEMMLDMTGNEAGTPGTEAAAAGAAAADAAAADAAAPAPGTVPGGRLTIKDGNQTRFVNIADINWVDAAGDYMCVHAAGETHIMRITMKELESLLDSSSFQRVHRSTIVNLARIQCAHSLENGEYLLELDCGSKLKVSRGYRDKVKQRFDMRT